MQYLYLCPICLIFAAVFIYIEAVGSYLLADVIKGIASALFVVFGVLSARHCEDPAFARMVVAGLVLGAIADVLLNLRYVFEGDMGQKAFLVGILVFLAGHIAYIVAAAPYCKLLPLAIIAGAAIATLLLYWIFGRVEAKPIFKRFGVFYIGAITILNCIALLVLIDRPNAHWAVFFGGTLLFLISDIILIFNTFGPKKSFTMRVSNLMLYYVGQLMIAASLQLPL